jgi:hypothetical protein
MFNSLLSKKILKTITLSTSFLCMFTVVSSQVYGMDDMWRGNGINNSTPKLSLKTKGVNSHNPLSTEQLEQLLVHHFVALEDEELCTMYTTDRLPRNSLNKPSGYIALAKSQERLELIHVYTKTRDIVEVTHRKTDRIFQEGNKPSYLRKIGERIELVRDVLAVFKEKNDNPLIVNEKKKFI